MSKIRAVLFGVGEMGKLSARYMLDKGIEIHGAFNRTSNLGEDLGIVAGLETPLNVPITNTPQDIIKNMDIDVAVVTTTSTMEQFYPTAESCLRNGINVVSITDEAFHPWVYDPELTEKLHELAVKNNVSIIGTGVQDIFWLNMPLIISGACHSIEMVEGTSMVNLDVYGPAVLEPYPMIGFTKEEYEAFKKENEESTAIPTFGIALEALVADLKLTIKDRRFDHAPVYADKAVESKALGKILPQGAVVGLLERYEIETEEDINFCVQFIEQISEDTSAASIGWSIKGEPSIQFTIDNFPGEEVTCATTVNRIPDVINAEPGFIGAGKLPQIRYRPLKFEKYIG